MAMDPTGTETYEGHEIRYFKTGSRTQLFTEDFLKVVPTAWNKLDPIETHLVDADMASVYARNCGNDAFADWIMETFPEDLIPGK